MQKSLHLKLSKTPLCASTCIFKLNQHRPEVETSSSKPGGAAYATPSLGGRAAVAVAVTLHGERVARRGGPGPPAWRRLAGLRPRPRQGPAGPGTRAGGARARAVQTLHRRVKRTRLLCKLAYCYPTPTKCHKVLHGMRKCFASDMLLHGHPL